MDTDRREDDMQQRRAEDRDRQLNDRLDRLEKQQEKTQGTVVALESSVNTLKLEQSHMREIVEARLRIIEDGTKLHNTNLEAVRNLITQQSDAADKSPAGREMLAKIRDGEEATRETKETCKEHKRRLDQLEEWQNQSKGAINLLRWLVGGGLAAIVGMLVWMIKSVKP